MRTFLIGAVLLFPLLAGCAGRRSKRPPAPTYQLQTLASGKQVRVIGTEVKNFPDGTPALMFKYETALNVEDIPAIRQEVTDVWENFRGEVERGKYKRAVVSVQGPPVDGSFKGYQYQFEQTEDGGWRPYRQR